MSENKFYIKTTITETINALCELTPDEYKYADEILHDIKNISDKNTLFKFIINDYFKENDKKRQSTIIYTITAVYENEKLKELLWNLLKSRHYNDEIQNKIIFLIKSLGDVINYDQYINYFENPDAVIDSDTEKLLTTATFNPEAQIDFLDFISTLNENDWQLMITSLGEDFEGDNLANIFIPLIYTNIQNSEKLSYLIEMLAKTSSSLAIEAYNDIVEYCSDENCKKIAKKQLSILKLKGKSKIKAQDFQIASLKNSEFYEAFVSYPDGHGNQCIIVTRKSQNETYQNFCAVVRDLNEILDCFGFYELSNSEYQKILKRFIQSQKLIKVHPDVVKAMIDNAIINSLKNRTKIPYEILCWKTNLCDTKDKFDIENKLKESLNPQYSTLKFKEDSFIIFDTWFYDENDLLFSDTLNSLFPTIDTEKLLNNFLNLLKTNSLKYETKKILTYRLQIMSMFMTLCGNKNLISVVAAINSNTAYEKLETFILKHSIYEYFLRERENINSKNITNIFTKKNDTNNKKFTPEQISKAIEYIEGNW